MKIHTAVLNQQRSLVPPSLPPLFFLPLPLLLDSLTISTEEAVLSASRLLLFCHSSLLPVFSLNTATKSNGLKVKWQKVAAGANRLRSKLEVNNEGAATHSEPFDPNYPLLHTGCTEEERDKMDDRPWQRGLMQGHAMKRRGRKWEGASNL